MNHISNPIANTIKQMVAIFSPFWLFWPTWFSDACIKLIKFIHINNTSRIIINIWTTKCGKIKQGLFFLMPYNIKMTAIVVMVAIISITRLVKDRTCKYKHERFPSILTTMNCLPVRRVFLGRWLDLQKVLQLQTIQLIRHRF